MTWTLSELAAIAEILGLIAIVPSLIFVGIQLARANRETRARTIQSALDSQMHLISTILEHSGTWDRMLADTSLAAGEETRTGILLYNLYMTEAESRYHQFRSGYLDPRSWEGHLGGLRPLLALKMYDVWRASPGANNHSADFLEIVDDLAERVSSE